MRVLVAGSGPVGRALAIALTRTGIEVTRWTRSGVLAAGQSLPAPSGGRGPCEVAVLAVSDGAIGEVAERLLTEGCAGKETVLLHCAGALPPEQVFAPVRDRVRGVGLLHPLRALAGATEDAEFAGTVFGVAGDEAGRAQAEQLALRIGGRPLALDAAGLGRYHAAAVLAGNHTLALVAAAIDLLVGEGLDREAAAAALGGLLGSAARNVAAHGLPDALTGPIARGDVAVVAMHLAALPEPVRALYRDSARPLLAVARAKGQAGEEAIAAIAALLSKEN
ncbi:MAG: DUF2520 domain-containing protein [Myxococcales bacterium]|nr:DUF2520 domain-containing protein [Myxococcales bacterium]